MSEKGRKLCSGKIVGEKQCGLDLTREVFGASATRQSLPVTRNKAL